MCARIAQPLDLPGLKDLGYINESINCEAFEPAGSWQLSFSILSCNGMKPSKSQHCGTFKISKKIDSGIIFTAGLELADEQGCFKCDVVNECLNDKMRTPVRYEALTNFRDADGVVCELLSGRESFLYEKPNMSIKVNGYSKTKTVAKPLTICGLIDMIQNLDFEEKQPFRFTFIESADIHKNGHSVRLRERSVFDNADGVKVPLYSYVQTGHGIIPTEYWLDESHRLIAFINSGRMYVADDLAVKS